MSEQWTPKSFESSWLPKSFEPIEEVVGQSREAKPETGIRGFISKRIPQLTGQEEGILNPDPMKNPLMLGSAILPKTEQEPGILGAIRHGLYENVIRPLASPLGLYGSFLGEGIPKEPIGTPSGARVFPLGSESIKPLGPLAPPKDISIPKLSLPEASIPKQLGPGARFIAGPAGIAERGKSYPLDLGELPVGDLGSVLPREAGETVQLTPEMAAARGTSLGQIPKITLPKKGEVINLNELNRRIGAVRERPTQIGGVPDYFVGTGKIGPVTQPSAVKTPRIGRKAPAQEGVKITQSEAGKVEIPKPGEAVAPVSIAPQVINKVGKDVSTIRSEIGSVDRTLNSRPETAPIASSIIEAADKKAQWVATTERRFADLIKDLGKSDRVKVGELLDKHENPAVSFPNDPLAHRAQLLRTEFNKIYDLIPEAAKTKAGGDIGFIENYLTHIKGIESADPDLFSGIKHVFDYHLGRQSTVGKLFTGAPLGEPPSKPSIGDMFERGLGKPTSQYVERRTGELKQYELDVKKVIPAYVESIAKVIYDRPAVDRARNVLASLPDKDVYGDPNKLKELAAWYIKNYTRYDSSPGLSRAWNELGYKIQRTTSRSMLGFSTGLQTLHLARIPANLWPELPTKYLSYGIGQVAKNPINAYRETASLGLLQNEVRPFTFKKPMEKVDSIISLFNAADFLDRSIGYHGFKKMLMDGGLNESEASIRAIGLSKKASLLSDTARPIRVFNPKAGLGGMIQKLSLQFKQVPVKIIEQYATIAANARKDPKAAARMVAGVGLALAAREAGLKTFHISLGNVGPENIGGAFGSVVYNVARNLAKGDLGKAVENTALWLTPGGYSIRHQLQRGPSAFENQ